MEKAILFMLKNQQYSTCIESCNKCMMACEACCTEYMTMMSSLKPTTNDEHEYGTMYDVMQRLC